MDLETIETLEKANAALMKMFKGSFEGLEENLQPFLELLVKHITQERERLGGDFAVATSVVFSRKQRDQLRELLGPKLKFMVLNMNMSKECQFERLEKKHGGRAPEFTDILFKYAELCEPAGEDEKNAFNIEITKDMTREDVIQKILEFADKA